MRDSLTIFVLLFGTAASLTNSFRADNLTRRASVGIYLKPGFYTPGGFYCTGTLVSRDVVLTAAHCLYGREISSIFVIHASKPSVLMPIRKVYVPEEYAKAAGFGKDKGFDAMRNCGTENCTNECVRETNNRWHDSLTKDYGMILLDKWPEICEYDLPHAPVVAVFKDDYVDDYVPAQWKKECFVVGYGAKSYKMNSHPNVAIVRKLDYVEYERCSINVRGFKGNFFHGSERDNETAYRGCNEDISGAAVQCIHDNGKQLRVLGVFTKLSETFHRGPTSTDDDFKSKCRIPDHDSFGIPIGRREMQEFFDVWEEWRHDVYLESYGMCIYFLEENPFRSVIENYVDGNPEFS